MVNTRFISIFPANCQYSTCEDDILSGAALLSELQKIKYITNIKVIEGSSSVEL